MTATESIRRVAAPFPLPVSRTMNQPRWAELAHYSGQFDADLDRSTLELAGIPVMTKGPLTGAFGPGYVGWTPEGVRLYVPAELLDEARAILHGAVNEDD